MYTLSEQQIDHILNDIKHRGVEMEDLQLNLLDHICCIIESDLDQGGDFESHYQKTIPKFFKKELKEIEDETIYLLTFKNYYAMKKTMIITGIVSVSLFIIGSLFKMMHWPGANVMLVSGIVLFSLLFLPLILILKTRDVSSKRDKLITAISSFIGILISIAVLVAVMHWPGSGSGVFWLTAIGVSVFALIPVYFFTGIRNPDTRTNTIVTSIVLIAASGLLFSMINLRPSFRLTQVKMHVYVQSEELLARLQTKADVSADGTVINKLCDQLKQMIISEGLNSNFIPKDFEDQNILMEEHSVGAPFFEQGSGSKTLSDLKAAIEKYNANTSNPAVKISLEHSVLNIDADHLGAYSNYTILTSINQLQMYLVETSLN